jgi:uncharacterized protein
MRVIDMNAFGSPIGSPNGVQREQTMEEILASIRKIIESNEAITSQTADDFVDYQSHDDHRAIEPTAPQVIAQPVQIAVAPVVQPVAEPAPTFQAEMARLVSQSPERRVAAAFDDLNSAFVKSKNMPIENVAEAMLHPMLKDWLDNNLPSLVERLVREEISRIARGDI